MTAGVRSGSAPALEAIRRRTTALLSVAQVMGGVAVAGSLPAGALIGASLGGSAAAGLAQTAGVLGAAVVALPLARIALSRGRRASLSAGYAIGALGATVVVIGGVHRALWTVLLGCLLLGAATAAGYQARYAATDLADPHHRGRALSTVVWAGTVGAVLGPNLLQVSGRLAMHDGLPQLTGPFVLAAGVLALSACLLLILLRPDPYLLSRSLSNADVLARSKPRLRDGLVHLKGHRRAQLGITSLSIGHVVMIMIMVMTPVHMQHVDVSLQLIGLVISVHVLGMFALSQSSAGGWTASAGSRSSSPVRGCCSAQR